MVPNADTPSENSVVCGGKPTTPNALHHKKQSLCTSFDIHPPLAKIQLKLKLEIKITIIKLTI